MRSSKKKYIIKASSNRKVVKASMQNGNYDASFKRNGSTYYIEMLEDAGNYVAKWWDTSDNGLGYNNKGFVGLRNDFGRNTGKFSSDNIMDYLYVNGEFDRGPSASIQKLIKSKVAKLIDYTAINSATSIKKKFTVKASCGKKSIKSAKDTSVSPDDVREVSLWIENDENMYRQYIQPNINNLRKKIKSGKYNPELAMKVWKRIADTGTKEYDKKYGSDGGKLFLNKATREEIAKSLMESFDEELNYDEVTSATIVANSEDEGKYLIENFYQDNFRGLADSAYADDYDSAVEIAHEFIGNGGSVSITNMENGESARYTYDDYFDGFEGDSPFYDAENEAMWSNNITSATDIEETEDDYITALADGTLGMIKANSDLEDAEYELSDAAITFIINGDNVYVQPIEEIVPNWDDLDTDTAELSNAVLDEIFI